MSFELHDYPGMPSVCAICKHDDCSKPGEMWIHLVTVEDRPAIGMNCVRLIADNVGLTKADEVIREISRPPTDAEIGQHIMHHLLQSDTKAAVRDLAHQLLEYSEGKDDDDNHSNPSTPSDSTGNVARPRAHRTSQRAKRTN